MFCLCCRIGELRALKYEDIEWNSNHTGASIWIRHQIVDKKCGSISRRATDVDYMKSHSSAGKRKFPLSEYALQVIQNLKALNPNSEYICSSSKGTPITTNRFNEKLREYCKEAGIPYYSSHKIRFCSASILYENGVPLAELQRMLGHTTTAMTLHYIRSVVSDERSRQIMEKALA